MKKKDGLNCFCRMDSGCYVMDVIQPMDQRMVSILKGWTKVTAGKNQRREGEAADE